MTWMETVFFTLNQKRMKNKPVRIQSKKVGGKNKSSANMLPNKLYAVCLNKPLIELWVLTDRYNNDYYDTTLRYKGSVYSRLSPAIPGDDRIPVILSPDDEMMLYNDGLCEYY
jgi:hypothetical protein